MFLDTLYKVQLFLSKFAHLFFFFETVKWIIKPNCGLVTSVTKGTRYFHACKMFYIFSILFFKCSLFQAHWFTFVTNMYFSLV